MPRFRERGQNQVCNKWDALGKEFRRIRDYLGSSDAVGGQGARQDAQIAAGIHRGNVQGARPMARAEDDNGELHGEHCGYGERCEFAAGFEPVWESEKSWGSWGVFPGQYCAKEQRRHWVSVINIARNAPK